MWELIREWPLGGLSSSSPRPVPTARVFSTVMAISVLLLLILSLLRLLRRRCGRWGRA